MDAFDSAPLLASSAHLDRAAVVGAGQQWTWREVHAASVALAGRLDPDATVCNLCESRAGFLITWLAALRRGCMQVLPPSGGSSDLLAILASSARPAIVVDDASLIRPHWAGHALCLVHAPEVAQGPVPSTTGLQWSPDWDAPSIRLYTSGSTGMPEAQVKTLGQLVRGAQVLGARLSAELDGTDNLLQIVCSVPSQHMFGIETCVMFPLLSGVSIFNGRPLLPADTRDAFEECRHGAAWITTPVHLRALVQSGTDLPHCRVVIASTMPLGAGLAVASEALVHAPVLEIYGSTETGAVAMRRTARGEAWRPLEGVRLAPLGDGTQIWGKHFASPRTLADQVQLRSDASFTLVGRQGDQIKIAGRRASLAGLNLLLQDMPGLTDGVFYLPPTGAPTERLVLIHSGETLDRAQADAWLRARMDPAFVPRRMIRVDRLPRTAAGKLPRAALDAIYAGQSLKTATP